MKEEICIFIVPLFMKWMLKEIFLAFVFRQLSSVSEFSSRKRLETAKIRLYFASAFRKRSGSSNAMNQGGDKIDQVLKEK
jgi:hypothetical protein